MEVDRTGLEQGWEVPYPFTPTLKCLLRPQLRVLGEKRNITHHSPGHQVLPRHIFWDNRKKLTGRDIGLFFFFFPSVHGILGEGNSNPLQYACLENFMDREPGGL